MGRLIISNSVGIGGKNTYNDIKNVQKALNLIINKIKIPHPLVIDGSLGRVPENSKTVHAIKIFQKKLVGLVHPDGRIDPMGRSNTKLNSVIKNLQNNQISSDLKQKIIQKLIEYENNIPYFYLDTQGNITIGIGNMIPNEEVATQIKLLKENKPASNEEIKKEYRKIKSMPYGSSWLAPRYKPYTSLRLTKNESMILVNKHIINSQRELENIYGKEKFSSYPDNVKLALFDMIFNLGAYKLKYTFVKFNYYIKESDFTSAANECHRLKIQRSRNNYVKNLLLGVKK